MVCFNVILKRPFFICLINTFATLILFLLLRFCLHMLPIVSFHSRFSIRHIITLIAVEYNSFMFDLHQKSRLAELLAISFPNLLM